MQLLDLEPKWLSQDMFIFRSPSGNRDLITCKRKPLTFKEQYDLVYPLYKGIPVAFTSYVWVFNNNFEDMTVTPSIDHSASGNWHGFIRDGEII